MTANYLTIWKREKMHDEVVQSVSLTNAFAVKITKREAHVSYCDCVAYHHTLRTGEYASFEEIKLPKGYIANRKDTNK